MHRQGSAGFVVGLIVLAVAGCAAPFAPSSTPGVAETVRPGAPDGMDIDLLGGTAAGTWLDDGERFAIITMGSGSCPPVATAITVESVDHLALTFSPSPNDPCTADMSATTHEFALPDGITGRPVTITVTYDDWDGIDTITLE